MLAAPGYPCPCCSTWQSGHVVCDGNQACQQAEIVCPDAHGCEVTCASPGPQACQELQVTCSATGTCKIDCAGGDACEAAAVDCGDNACAAKCAPSGSEPSVQCDRACQCTECS